MLEQVDAWLMRGRIVWARRDVLAVVVKRKHSRGAGPGLALVVGIADLEVDGARVAGARAAKVQLGGDDPPRMRDRDVDVD